MSKGRRTIDVDRIKEWVNTRLATPSSTHSRYLDNLTPEQAFRLGIASLLEQVLHHTGNYKGFGYQESEKNPEYVDGITTPDANWLRDNHDDTRRHYY